MPMEIITYAFAGIYSLHVLILWFYALIGVTNKIMPRVPTGERLGLAAALLRFIFFVPISVLGTWLAFLGAPVYALFSWHGRLIHPLRFLSTHDEWLYGMVTQIHRYPMPSNIFKRYWLRVLWILRNPAYHLAHHMLGYAARRVQATATADVRNATIVGSREDGFIATAVWGDAFSVPVYLFGLRVEVGWKLWRGDNLDPDGTCMLATKVSFYKA
jgi:hypothetical protein